MISYNKMSKKQKKEYNQLKRNMWDFRPVTRVKPSAKVYNRKKINYAE